jgi:hypothetical protein
LIRINPLSRYTWQTLRWQLSTVWLVNLSNAPNHELALDLIGDYSVRAFASLKSLMILTKVQKSLPDAVIFDASGINSDLRMQIGHASKLLSDLPRFIVVDDIKQANDCLTPELRAKFVLLEADATSFEVSTQIKDVLKYHESTGLNCRKRLKFEDIELDLDGNELHLPDIGEVYSLTPKETQILSCLILAPGRSITRESLAQKIWRGMKISDRNMDSHISRIRAKLSNSGRTIESVYGAGYSIK